MQDGWFYANDDKPVGPLSFDALIANLRSMSNPETAGVWHASLTDWRIAKDVPQIAACISRPPPISTTRSTFEASNKSAPDEIQNKNVRGRIAFFVVLAIALLIAAALSNLIYDNSVSGFAYLGGQFLGATIVISAFLLWRRPTPAKAAIALAIATFLLSSAIAKSFRMVSLPIKLRQPSREFQFLTTHKSKRYSNEIHQTSFYN